MDAELQAQIEICNKEFFTKLGDGGNKTKDPLFIL